MKIRRKERRFNAVVVFVVIVVRKNMTPRSQGCSWRPVALPVTVHCQRETARHLLVPQSLQKGQIVIPLVTQGHANVVTGIGRIGMILAQNIDGVF